VVPMGFQGDGDDVFVLGIEALRGDAAELACSEYLKLFHDGLVAGRPSIDLDLEVRLQKLSLEAARGGLLSSAHDCSRGGLAVALAGCCFPNGLGLDASGVAIEGRLDAALFGEAPSRIVVSTGRAEELARLAEEHDVPLLRLGVVGGERLAIAGEIDALVADLEAAYEDGLPRALGAS